MIEEILRIHYQDENVTKHLSNKLSEIIDENTVIFNIGTDRCIGDAFAPIIGTMLIDKGIIIPVYGTLSNPIHALNLNEHIEAVKSVHPNAKIIAIDACLGGEESIGKISIRNKPIAPGKGVGKKLQSIGDNSIVFVVEEYGNYSRLNNVRLDFIMNAAQIVSNSIISSLGRVNCGM